MVWANLHKTYPNVITLREFAEKLSNLASGKPNDPNSVLTSSVNQVDHVTSKGLITVKMVKMSEMGNIK